MRDVIIAKWKADETLMKADYPAYLKTYRNDNSFYLSNKSNKKPAIAKGWRASSGRQPYHL